MKQPKKIYIGIDPGKNGGIAWCVDGKDTHAIRMGKTYEANWEVIDNLLCSGTRAHILVEQVHSMSKQGVTSSFNFGDAYGHAKSLAAVSSLVHNCKWDLVTPQRWQKHMGLIMKGKVGTTVKKNKHKQLAATYTTLSVTHAISDAILIAQYNYEVHKE